MANRALKMLHSRRFLPLIATQFLGTGKTGYVGATALAEQLLGSEQVASAPRHGT